MPRQTSNEGLTEQTRGGKSSGQQTMTNTGNKKTQPSDFYGAELEAKSTENNDGTPGKRNKKDTSETFVSNVNHTHLGSQDSSQNQQMSDYSKHPYQGPNSQANSGGRHLSQKSDANLNSVYSNSKGFEKAKKQKSED